MSALRSFAPWIAFTITSAIADWRLAAALALCISLAGAVARRRQVAEPDDLANATTVFFAALTLVSIAHPSSGLQHYIPALAPAALSIGAGLSILRGRPFTIPFAKRSTPAELWDQPRFYTANVTISMIWTVSFALTAALLTTVLATAAHPAGLVVEIEILAFVVPMRCTAFYRRRLRARYAALATA
jgi:hypothetical protein